MLYLREIRRLPIQKTRIQSYSRNAIRIDIHSCTRAVSLGLTEYTAMNKAYSFLSAAMDAKAKVLCKYMSPPSLIVTDKFECKT